MRPWCCTVPHYAHAQPQAHLDDVNRPILASISLVSAGLELLQRCKGMEQCGANVSRERRTPLRAHAYAHAHAHAHAHDTATPHTHPRTHVYLHMYTCTHAHTHVATATNGNQQQHTATKAINGGVPGQVADDISGLRRLDLLAAYRAHMAIWGRLLQLPQQALPYAPHACGRVHSDVRLRMAGCMCSAAM